MIKNEIEELRLPSINSVISILNKLNNQFDHPLTAGIAY